MYTFTDRTFIVWGGNQLLANKVSERLGRKTKGAKMEIIVGGAAEYIGEDSFVGPRVISQMNICSKALILAKPYLDEKSGTYRYRENLMFEWGYLMSRLPRGSIAVYLIGADRTTLPSDLQGAFTAIVPAHLTDENQQSTYIAKNYKTLLDSKENFVVFDMMLDWQKWKNFINRQLTGIDAPRPELFRKVLMNAYMPCSYCDDIEYYKSIFGQVDLVDQDESGYLGLARSILNFTVFVRSKESFVFGEFSEVKRGFSNFAGYKDPFFAAVARHFMGLCLKLEAKSLADHEHEKKIQYNQHALQHFETVAKYFETATNNNEFTTKIWLGFVYSNIAQCYDSLGRQTDACKYFGRCDENQNFICGVLSTGKSRDIYQSYLAERYFQILRHHRCAGLQDEDAYIEIRLKYDEIKDRSTGYTWSKIIKDIDKYFHDKYSIH